MYVKKFLNFYEGVKKFLDSRFNRTLFFSLIVIGTFFSAFNVYAGGPLNLGSVHEESVTVPVTLTGVSSENTQLFDSKTSTARMVNLTTMIVPQVWDNYEELASNPDVSYSTRAGAFGVANDTLHALMYSQPEVDVASHLAQEWIPGYEGTTSSVYANGYEELQNAGVSGLWSRMRNIAYLMFVVVLIVAGFMIMFRSKLGGQTVVTLGNMIPNVIIALILATFSFAIVGIIIDFGVMLSRLVLDILYGDVSIFSYVNTKNPFTIMFSYMSTGASVMWTDLTESLSNPLSSDALINIASYIVGGTAAVAGGMLTILVVLIIAGIMIFGAIKVWITLLKSYISILINVITGPIVIALSAIPGQSHMLGNWLKGTLRHVLAFPLVLAMVNLPFALWGEDLAFPGLPEGLVTPTVDGGGSDAVATALSGLVGLDKALLSILGIVMLFMAAQAPKFLESILPANTNKAVGDGVGAAKAAFSKIPLVGKLFG